MGKRRIFQKGSRDDNEKGITEILRIRKIKYALLSEGDGADILIYISPMAFVEVKNPSYEWEYTEKELEVQAYCKDLKIPYHTVETPEEMSKIIDDWIQSIERNIV